LAVFQAFSLTKLRISKLLPQKLKFWENFRDKSYYFHGRISGIIRKGREDREYFKEKY
jgi:hypothetical protein